jgi:GST-like protein
LRHLPHYPLELSASKHHFTHISKKCLSHAAKKAKNMTDAPEYTPDKVWTWDSESGGRFASINRPIAGPTSDRDLPVGKHPIQLYSLATPNGVKVTVLLEELLAAGHTGAEYDAWLINIMEGDQFTSGFVNVNPNSKIPAMMDHSGDTPQRIFESASMMMYLAEKFDAFIPKDPSQRTEMYSWLFWQMGSAPYLGGGFGHFYAYAPHKDEYAINRFTMEAKRQLDVMDRHLAENEWFAGDYSIADMAIWSWYGQLVLGRLYSAAEFLDVASYKNVMRWAKAIDARPAVTRGRMVNRAFGDDLAMQLHERHDASDFDTKTQDKVQAGS